MKDFKLTFSSLGWLVTELNKLLKNSNKAYRVNVVEWREKRTISQNALYWKWLSEIDQQNPLKVDGSKIQGNELWHEVFKKYYCPEKVITNGTVNLPTKSTKILDAGEMTFYLNRIEQWCIDRGIALTIPETSEYYQLIQSQIQ